VVVSASNWAILLQAARDRGQFPVLFLSLERAMRILEKYYHPYRFRLGKFNAIFHIIYLHTFLFFGVKYA